VRKPGTITAALMSGKCGIFHVLSIVLSWNGVDGFVMKFSRSLICSVASVLFQEKIDGS